MNTNLAKGMARGCLLAVGLGAGLLVVGCERDETVHGAERDEGTKFDPGKAPVPAAPASAQKQADVARTEVSQALDSIASARCDRAASCNNVGEDKKFATKQECVEKVKEDKLEGLNSAECKLGVDQQSLSDCLTSIRNEDCNSPLDTLSRLAACRSSVMCKGAAPKP